MAGIQFDKVTKVFEGGSSAIMAVDELDIDVADGEFLVMVGPSGSGKSTSLRMLAGLESITDGEIRIGDRVVNDMPPRERDLAMVFQDNALYPHKTVRGNMAYGLKLRTSLSKEEINARVEEAAEMMGIGDLLDKKPGALSGGQQQRVATGRAIVREPSVFLFDEPLSDLDANLRKHMRTELARIHTELGITSIYVTHDQEEAMTLADRIAILHEGELQQIGRPTHVYSNPENMFVADFIGSPNINFFEVDLDESRDDPVLVHDVFEYRISDGLLKRVRESTDGTELVLGVRPETVRIADGPEPGRTVPGTVMVVETVGSDNFVYLDVNGSETRVRAPASVMPEVDDELHVTFEEEDVYLFDRGTEESVLDRMRTETALVQ
jgi:multiple sugar transport system ATP-binding protein